MIDGLEKAAGVSFSKLMAAVGRRGSSIQRAIEDSPRGYHNTGSVGIGTAAQLRRLADKYTARGIRTPKAPIFSQGYASKDAGNFLRSIIPSSSTYPDAFGGNLSRNMIEVGKPYTGIRGLINKVLGLGRG